MNAKLCKRLRKRARDETIGEGVDSTRIAYRALKMMSAYADRPLPQNAKQPKDMPPKAIDGEAPKRDCGKTVRTLHCVGGTRPNKKFTRRKNRNTIPLPRDVAVPPWLLKIFASYAPQPEDKA